MQRGTPTGAWPTPIADRARLEAAGQISVLSVVALMGMVAEVVALEGCERRHEQRQAGDESRDGVRPRPMKHETMRRLVNHHAQRMARHGAERERAEHQDPHRRMTREQDAQ